MITVTFLASKRVIYCVHLLFVKLFLFILVVVALSACSDLKKRGHLEDVTKLQDRIQSSEETLLENELENRDELFIAKENVYLNIEQLEDDTISLDRALVLDQMKYMFTLLEPVSSQYDALIELIKEEKSILDKLEADIEKANGKRHKYDEYIRYEKEKVAKLERAVTKYVESKTQISNTLEELHNEITELNVEPNDFEEVQ